LITKTENLAFNVILWLLSRDALEPDLQPPFRLVPIVPKTSRLLHPLDQGSSMTLSRTECARKSAGAVSGPLDTK